MCFYILVQKLSPMEQKQTSNILFLLNGVRGKKNRNEQTRWSSYDDWYRFAIDSVIIKIEQSQENCPDHDIILCLMLANPWQFNEMNFNRDFIK